MVNSFAVNETGAPAAIRVGDVLADSLRLFLARAVPFIGLSIIAFAPTFILGLFVSGAAASSSTALLGFITVIVRLACSSLANAAIIYGVVQELRGRGFTFSDSLRIGFGRLGPVIGLSLLVGVLVTLAAILLVVPGIIVWTIYAVVVPVCVVETLGPTASMSRSAFLTKGNRWRIFGVFALIFIASIVVGGIVGGLAGLTGGLRLVQVATFAIEAIIGAFNAVVVGVLYYQLRVAREGADIEKIAAVFD
jgi:MFS family permease